MPPAGWSRFDLVVCRNVLIYFDPIEAVEVARRLDSARRSSGQLVVGAVEQAMLGQVRAVESPARALAAVLRAQSATPRIASPELDAEVHLRRGIADKRADRLPSAIEHLRRARFLAGDRWLAPYLLGLCLEAVGRPGEAREAYRHAIGAVAAGGHAGLSDAELDATTMATTVSGACHARLAALG